MLSIRPVQHPFVSVIVPVYHDTARLVLCLDALEHQSYPAECFEVVVVDNGTRTTLGPPIANYHQSRLVHESRPGSYAARNCGIRASRGEILAFTDSDCVPTRDWIHTGVATLQEYPDVALLGGRIELYARDPRSPTATERHELLLGLDQCDFVTRSRFAATANVFTFRRFFDDVGLFNDDFYSCGDVEWGQRLHAAGYRQKYVDQLRVRHPARHSIGALVTKHRRKMGGYYRLAQTTQRTPSSVAATFLDSPWTNFIRQRRQGKLRGLRPSLQFLLVDIALSAARVFECLRLHLGGNPRRS
jgi:glycosyltransferase involved in cell wall biosynthesis